jgi:hypothetical protein
MLVCSVSLRALRRAIAADLAEVVEAADATASGQVVFATLVDDPAAVNEIVDAYLGEIMLEAASASDAISATIPSTFDAAIDEAVTAATAQDATLAAPAVTWDAATTVNATLSNGDLTATHANSTGNSGARVASAAAKSSGKYYFEIFCNTVNSTDVLGLTAPGNNYNTVLIGSASTMFVAPGNGNMNVAAGFAGNIGAFVANDVAGFAVDVGAGKVWIRRNAGNWNGSGTANPATGVGGFSFTPIAIAPVIGFGSGSPSAYTGNFGATSYTNAAPSGFGNWTP